MLHTCCPSRPSWRGVSSVSGASRPLLLRRRSTRIVVVAWVWGISQSCTPLGFWTHYPAIRDCKPSPHPPATHSPRTMLSSLLSPSSALTLSPDSHPYTSRGQHSRCGVTPSKWPMCRTHRVPPTPPAPATSDLHRWQQNGSTALVWGFGSDRGWPHCGMQGAR